MKPTRETLTNFINENKDNLYLRREKSFFGDCHMPEISRDFEKIKPVEGSEYNKQKTLGIQGIWLDGKDCFEHFENHTYEGVHFFNIQNSATIAINKKHKSEKETTTVEVTAKTLKRMDTKKKITKATFKSFIKKNRANLLVKVESSFNGMSDMVETVDDTFEPAINTNQYDSNTCGISGIWLVGSSRDYFNTYEDDTYTGIHFNNCCGSGTIAIAKQQPVKEETTVKPVEEAEVVEAPEEVKPVEEVKETEATKEEAKNYRITFGSGEDTVIVHEENCELFSLAIMQLEIKGFDFTTVSKIETFEFNTNSIDKAMKGDNFWLDSDSLESYIVQRATALNYINRISHTQVEWTEKSLAKARKELDGIEEEVKPEPEEEIIYQNDINRFEVGKVYSHGYIGDSSLKTSYKVLKRTPQTVVIQDINGGESVTRKISIYDKSEMVLPNGRYSMCPTLKAEKEASTLLRIV